MTMMMMMMMTTTIEFWSFSFGLRVARNPRRCRRQRSHFQNFLVRRRRRRRRLRRC